MAWSAPTTFVAGDVLTAAQLNANIKDNFAAVFVTPTDPTAAWTTFAPTLTQSGALTNTVTYARYMKVGRWVVAQTNLAITSAGTGNNYVQVGLPVTAAALNYAVGAFYYLDSGTAIYTGVANASLSTSYVVGTAHALTDNIGKAPNFAAASGDTVAYSVVYEAAS